MIADNLIEQSVVPNPPPAGRVELYADTNHNVFVEDPTGASRQLDGGGTATPDFIVGFWEYFSTTDTKAASQLDAFPIELTDSAQAKSISVFVQTIGTGRICAGIYSNLTTDPSIPEYPDALLALTANFTPVKGWNEALITAAVTLAVGTYWIVVFTEIGDLVLMRTTSADRFLVTKTPGVGGPSFSSGLPSAFPGPLGVDFVTNVNSVFASMTPV